MINKPTLTLIQNFSVDRQESILRYGQVLQTQLTDRLGKNRVCSISAYPITTKIFYNENKLKKITSYIDKLLLFNARLIITPSTSLYHVVCQPEYVTSLVGKTKLITCHDLIPLLQEKENLAGGLAPGSWSSLLLRWWELAYKSADHIVCVSESTRQDLLKLIPINQTKTSVIYNGLNREFKPVFPGKAKQLIAAYSPVLVNQPFIMNVGKPYSHKNRPGIIEVFNRLAAKFIDLQMVFCGQAFSNIENAKLTESPFKSRIHQLWNISDELLDALYSQARLLLFPSLYEGFGWPIIEAMACGCPSVGSNRGSLKEVALNSDLAPDPENYDQIAAICERLHTDINYRQDIIRRGWQHCENFTTERMINQYMELYQMLGMKI